MEPVKKGCEGAQYVLNKAYEYREQILDGVQLALDIAGFVPILGDALDGVNGVISLARGNTLDAALSFAAMIPFAGDAATVGKLAMKAEKALDIVKATDKAIDLVKGGEKALDLTKTIEKGISKSDFIVAPGGTVNPYDLLKDRGIPSAFDDLDREIFDSENWIVKYQGVADEIEKKVPNPFRKNGGSLHQGKIQEIADKLKSEGYNIIFEKNVKTPGGNKSSRYGDMLATNLETGEQFIIQVGKQTKSGKPISRETKAIQDLENAGWKVEFISYN